MVRDQALLVGNQIRVAGRRNIELSEIRDRRHVVTEHLSTDAVEVHHGRIRMRFTISFYLSFFLCFLSRYIRSNDDLEDDGDREDDDQHHRDLLSADFVSCQKHKDGSEAVRTVEIERKENDVEICADQRHGQNSKHEESQDQHDDPLLVEFFFQMIADNGKSGDQKKDRDGDLARHGQNDLGQIEQAVAFLGILQVEDEVDINEFAKIINACQEHNDRGTHGGNTTEKYSGIGKEDAELFADQKPQEVASDEGEIKHAYIELDHEDGAAHQADNEHGTVGDVAYLLFLIPECFFQKEIGGDHKRCQKHVLRFREVGQDIFQTETGDDHQKKSGQERMLFIAEQTHGLVSEEIGNGVTKIGNDPGAPVGLAGNEKAECVDQIGKRTLVIEKIAVGCFSLEKTDTDGLVADLVRAEVIAVKRRKRGQTERQDEKEDADQRRIQTILIRFQCVFVFLQCQIFTHTVSLTRFHKKSSQIPCDY